MVTTINVTLEDEDAEAIRAKKDDLGVTWEEFLRLTVEDPERLVRD